MDIDTMVSNLDNSVVCFGNMVSLKKDDAHGQISE